MVIVDEKSQATDLACSGTRFDHVGDRLLRLSRSYVFTKQKLELMKEMGQLSENEKQEYTIDMSLLLDFAHKDPTIAFLESANLPDPGDMEDGKFNAKLFDSQFLKYF